MTDLQRGRPTTNSMRRALKRARDEVALDVTEAAVLLQARGDDLTDLAASAARVRDAGLEAAGRPGVITYSRKVFIPLTRLCRDKCHYCTFVTVPGKLRKAGHGMFLSPDEVLDIARKGAEMGCKEALFTLGDRPEDRWPEAREWLEAEGYDDTLAYVRAMAIRVLEETGLLPHLNPGVLTWTDLQRLKPVAPSMGMMLETTATRLWSEPGGPHHGSPDKEPAVRLRVLEDAGRSNVPFTTGILIGIGESYEERADSSSSSARPPAPTTASRRSSSRTSAPSPTRRCAGCRTPNWRSWPRPSPWPATSSARPPASRPRRTSSTPSTHCSSAPGSTTGAVSRRSPRTT